MPITSLSIQQQLQAVSAGFRAYPQMTGITKDAIFIDQFNRTTLNPTNAYELYATVADNSGTVTINNETRVRMTTGTTIGNHAVIRTDELVLNRTSFSPDSKSALTFRFFPALVQTADTEFFCGITNATVDLITLPDENDIHMGLQLNRSASANWFFTSANGTTQVTADTGITATTGTVTLTIRLTGIDAATMTILLGNESAETTITAFNSSSVNIQAITQTEGAAAKSADLNEWSVQAA